MLATVLGSVCAASSRTTLLRRTALLMTSRVVEPLQVAQIPCLSDNYGFLLHDASSGMTACVDTPEVGPILAACEQRGWTLTHILNTHHHWDHAGGNEEIKELTGCEVIGPASETDKIPSIDRGVGGGDVFEFAGHEVRVLDVGGHTLGQIAFYLPSAGLAFVGDALFALGCGRLFEGTAEQAWASLQRLAALPPETQIYCAHEYTEANLRFSLSVEPGNDALQERALEIQGLRAAGRPTVPTTIGLELATNPFLRPSSPMLRAHVGVPVDESEEATFARLRQMKDEF
jgi:hydroxyacylglutathione hydrolase